MAVESDSEDDIDMIDGHYDDEESGEDIGQFDLEAEEGEVESSDMEDESEDDKELMKKLNALSGKGKKPVMVPSDDSDSSNE